MFDPLTLVTWFAVDRDGHVARFDATPAGAIPTSAILDEAEVEAVEEALQANAIEHGVWQEFAQPEDAEDDVAEPYRRSMLDDLAQEIEDDTPPLLAEHLRADIRSLVERVRFADLCFCTGPHVQPALSFECELPARGYRDLDGKLVR